MSEWTELLWNRALAKRVSDVTLIVDQLLPVPRRHGVVRAARRAGQRASATTAHARRRVRSDTRAAA
jgi:hypothetical protein